jgi:peptidoglycan/LPS O-acetylase OafA/YrhL
MNAKTKLNNIQVLRAFAATAVVFLHSGYHFPHMNAFGAFGVDVFFVISGFIMARIIDPDSDSSSDFFFRRRVLRIVPPYWLFTFLLYFAAMAVPQYMQGTRADGTELLKSLFFLPFAKTNGIIQPLLFCGWSLNYEMFFYLALTVGMVLSKRHASWIGSGIVLVTMLACLPFASESIVAKFYSTTIVLEFLFGIFCYYLCRAVPTAMAVRLRIPAVAVSGLSVLALVLSEAFLDVPRVVILGIPALLLVTSANILSQSGWDSRQGFLVLIGDASYILYLVHPYSEYSITRVLGTRLHFLASDTVTGMPIAIAISIAIAILIHIYGERPTVRFLNRRFGGSRKSVEFSTPAAV